MYSSKLGFVGSVAIENYDFETWRPIRATHELRIDGGCGLVDVAAGLVTDRDFGTKSFAQYIDDRSAVMGKYFC
jgi:hypothetical protein